MIKKIFLIILVLFNINFLIAVNITSLDDTNSTLNKSISYKNFNNSKNFDFENTNNPYKNKQFKELKINGQKVKFEKLNSKNLRYSKTKESKRVLMKFNRNPSKYEIEQLKKEGIELLDYMGSNSYYVKTSKNYNNLFEIKNTALKLKSKNINDKYLIRNTAEVKKEYKLSKNLRENNVKNWAKDDKGYIYLNVQFHRDVTLEEAEKLMKEKGFQVVSRLESINALTIKVYGGETKK